jgi:hypothetical protein
MLSGNKKGEMRMDSRAKALMMEERLEEALGAEAFLYALQKALSVDVRLDVYEYIARNYEVPMEDDDEEEYCPFCGSEKMKGYLCPECGRLDGGRL